MDTIPNLTVVLGVLLCVAAIGWLASIVMLLSRAGRPVRSLEKSNRWYYVQCVDNGRRQSPNEIRLLVISDSSPVPLYILIPRSLVKGTPRGDSWIKMYKKDKNLVYEFRQGPGNAPPEN